jgi:hypothetical protein
MCGNSQGFYQGNEMTKEFLNKFSIGDIVHTDARIVGILSNEDVEHLYTIDIINNNNHTTRIYDVPECFIAKVF